jgi:hypothetical protein
MITTLLRAMVGIVLVTMFLGTPPAHAIFGIRAARTALAARKAKQQMDSSSSPTPEEAYDEEKAKFGSQTVRENKTVAHTRNANSALESGEKI